MTRAVYYTPGTSARGGEVAAACSKFWYGFFVFCTFGAAVVGIIGASMYFVDKKDHWTNNVAKANSTAYIGDTEHTGYLSVLAVDETTNSKAWLRVGVPRVLCQLQTHYLVDETLVCSDLSATGGPMHFDSSWDIGLCPLVTIGTAQSNFTLPNAGVFTVRLSIHSDSATGKGPVSDSAYFTLSTLSGYTVARAEWNEKVESNAAVAGQVTLVSTRYYNAGEVLTLSSTCDGGPDVAFSQGSLTIVEEYQTDQQRVLVTPAPTAAPTPAPTP